VPRLKRGALSTTSFITKDVLLCRTPGDQLVAMNSVEIRYVADPDFQKIVEVAREQMQSSMNFNFATASPRP
jgi:hypothetical protein